MPLSSLTDGSTLTGSTRFQQRRRHTDHLSLVPGEIFTFRGKNPLTVKVAANGNGVRIFDESGTNLAFVNCSIDHPRVVESLVRSHRRMRTRMIDAGFTDFHLTVSRVEVGFLGVRLDARCRDSKLTVPPRTSSRQPRIVIRDDDFNAAYDEGCALFSKALDVAGAVD